jgi:integrase
MVHLIQSKTQSPLKANLHKDAIKMLGPKGPKKDLVFKLPSTTAVRKLLINWAEKAKVDKHVTYHVARHSFGTSLIVHGADVKTASELLGQKS